MPYTTGSAADMAAVKTALVNACTADGWTKQTDAGGKTVLDKNGIYVRVEVIINKDGDGNDALEVLGRTSLDGGDAPNVVSMGPLKTDSTTPHTISFPVTYHAFTFTNEVFFVIQYNNFYQWCAFGQSQQNGLSGTGNWVAATLGGNGQYSVRISSSFGGSNYQTSAALFWGTDYSASYGTINRNAWLHNDIEASYPWALDLGTNAGNPVGIQYLTELIDTQPNDYNLESVLMPIRAYKKRPESKVSQIGEIQNARHIRIDHYNDEQVITMGTDDWMVFPYFSRDAENRDGGNASLHTGTFGWAILKA